MCSGGTSLLRRQKLGVFLLTDTEIRKSKPGSEAYRLADGHGLYLWITPAGGKLWRWKYRFDGKEKLMALGKYPEVPLAHAPHIHIACSDSLHRRC